MDRINLANMLYNNSMKMLKIPDFKDIFLFHLPKNPNCSDDKVHN